MSSPAHYLLQEAANGNQAAAEFLRMVVDGAHLWDDLRDQDKPIEEGRLNETFMHLFVELPRNPFFHRHVAELTPILLNAFQNWQLANAIEAGKTGTYDVPLECAFILRSSYVDIITAVATICGGHKHAAHIALRARALAHEEGFKGYKLNLAAEHTARALENT